MSKHRKGYTKSALDAIVEKHVLKRESSNESFGLGVVNIKRGVSDSESELGDDRSIENVVEKRNVNKARIMASRNRDLQDERFKQIYNAVKDLIIGRQFNIRQFTIIVPLAMQIMSEVKTLSGDQKKDTLITVFRYIVQDMEFESLEQEKLAAHFVENNLDVLIETAYSAFKGKFVFKDETLDESFDMAKFDMVYSHVRGLIIDKSLNIKSIVILVPSVMMQVARFVNLTGLQKKDLVVQILQKLLMEFKPEGDTEQLILLFVQRQLPSVIEVIYQAGKGKYVFKKIQTGTKTFWKKITPCLR